MPAMSHPTSSRPLALADHIDRLNSAVGHSAAWCGLAVVAIQFVVVLLRYVLGLGSIWLSELIVYAHAGLFMLAAGWTLAIGGHVRVDIFYTAASPRRQALIDFCGALLLGIPFMVALFVLSLPYVSRSWAILEGSREASGLPLVYLLKTLIPVFAVLLCLQCVSQAIRAWSVLRQSSRAAEASR
jgi:TRAP-type mannitol/chloroaromatic compound transport system permease small subunit